MLILISYLAMENNFYFRSLLLPKPMKEIRVKGQYDEHKEIQAAQGVKIAARDLEKAIAGLNLQVAYHEDEVELLKEQVDKEFSNAMKAIKVRFIKIFVFFYCYKR